MLLGLKTLEVWVDSLNPDFLEPAVADVVGDLMPALWAMLKPGHPLSTKVGAGCRVYS
jgi:transformation/transcription domain-associated protein